MPSILIHGGNRQSRREVISRLLAERGIESNQNLIEIREDEKKIGINEIKTFLPHLHIRIPNNKQRGFIIPEAQRLTTAAQNSLLKILEEPPSHLVIILATPNPRLLLPTVASRCLITPAPSGAGQAEAQDGLIKEIFNAQSGQRLMVFEEKIGYGQEGVLTFLDEVEGHLKKGLNSKAAQLLTKLWRAKKLLRDESANTKLIVDELLLSW